MGIQARVYDLKRASDLPLEVDFVEGDIRDFEKIKIAVKDCEVVYHLVGLLPHLRAGRETMQAVNVGGTENVLRAASEAGVKRVVFLSSSEVYGRPRIVPMPENHPLDPIGEYGRNKVAAEGICRNYHEKTGIEVVILRPTTLVGPGIKEPAFLKSMKLAKRAPFFCIGKGDNRFQMVYVDDVAKACVIASGKDGISGEEFNLGSENVLPLREQFIQLAKYLKRKPRIFSIPPGLFKAIMRILNRFGLSPMEPDHFELADSDFIMDINKAKDKLGWTPTKNNMEMIIETYKWYLTNF
jgi:nucleoside-diphosphate-sugar epimerase